MRGEVSAELLRDFRGSFEWCAVRHVDNDLEFALVVKRKHLDAYPLERNEHHGCEQQGDDTYEKCRTLFGLGNERSHDSAV